MPESDLERFCTIDDCDCGWPKHGAKGEGMSEHIDSVLASAGEAARRSKARFEARREAVKRDKERAASGHAGAVLMPDIRPPEEAVEAAAEVLRREDWRLVSTAYAPIRAVLYSEPVQELVEALRKEHSFFYGHPVFAPEDCSTCDIIRRWTQEEGTG